MKIHRPQPDWMEIDPDELYASILEVVNLAIRGMLFLIKFLISIKHILTSL